MRTALISNHMVKQNIFVLPFLGTLPLPDNSSLVKCLSDGIHLLIYYQTLMTFTHISMTHFQIIIKHSTTDGTMNCYRMPAGWFTPWSDPWVYINLTVLVLAIPPRSPWIGKFTASVWPHIFRIWDRTNVVINNVKVKIYRLRIKWHMILCFIILCFVILRYVSLHFALSIQI